MLSLYSNTAISNVTLKAKYAHTLLFFILYKEYSQYSLPHLLALLYANASKIENKAPIHNTNPRS